jgi:uncharacterized protein (UPF0332 family)
VSLHADLLHQAGQLAKREPRRPRQASLRRAISAAYYAVFHLLVDEATKRLVTGASRGALRHLLGRAFAHSDMKVAAEGFANGNISPKIRPALGKLRVQPELASVASAFIDLQQARHEADYDTAHRFTRQECLDLVEQAEKTFAHWETVRQTLQADTFLVALLAQKRVRS